MMPSQLRAYLRQRGEASLADLTAHFDTDMEMVKDQLVYWQKKGKILETAAGCGKTCCSCDSKIVFYRWKE
jgi:DeoR/GlpR family transcriptional regulator of sugar metabolism